MNTVEKKIPFGVMFHHFHDQTHAPGQGSISQDQLAKLIHHLGRDNILPAREWQKRALNDSLGANDICLTFDDSLRCQYDIALPVLKSLRIEAFWFVYTSVIEGEVENLEIYRLFRNTQFQSVDQFYRSFFSYLENSPEHAEVCEKLQTFQPRLYLREFSFYSDDDRKFRFVRDQILGSERYNQAMDQIIRQTAFDPDKAAQKLWMNATHLKELNDSGHVIGLHSHNHPTALNQLSVNRQIEEYQNNIRVLEKILGEVPSTMSHPCNSYSAQTLQVLKQLGVQLGFRSNMAPIENRTPLEFPREDHINILKQISA
jgi:peptidoglycan/xylan/chitin deacetylase (PgdA/CDA1 family)